MDPEAAVDGPLCRSAQQLEVMIFRSAAQTQAVRAECIKAERLSTVGDYAEIMRKNARLMIFLLLNPTSDIRTADRCAQFPARSSR